MSQPGRAIRSVCVAGAGTVGLSAALAFARALPGVEITVVDTPADQNALTERQPASLPTIHRFHRAIGVDELDLVRRGIASHLLGTRFEHWSASGQPWAHAFGEHGLRAGEVPFHAIFAANHSPGDRPFHDYSAAAVLAQAGKFAHPSPDPDTPMGSFLYGLRLDPERYRTHLAELCQAPRRKGAIAGIERREDGGIAALVLADGQRVAADLYLDCTGPAAVLLTSLDPSLESWRQWLPCDTFSITREPAEEPVALDTVRALDAGWRWRSPMPDGTLLIQAGSSGESSANLATLEAGRRPSPWIRNVLALGDAAVAIDPLHGAGLHLAHSAILRALELLPGRDCHPLELREYNRRAEEEAIRVRDFLALPYLRSGRSDTPFWQGLAPCEPPPSLARTLEQFVRRGRLPFFEHESFEPDSWFAALFGLGILPDEADPAALDVDPRRAQEAMAAYAKRLAALPARLPGYHALLARMRFES